MFNYLHLRKAIPFFEGVKGPEMDLQAGVPQGSCLGPLLYIIFVNDAPKTVYMDTFISQFADDKIHIVRSKRRGLAVDSVAVALGKLKKELLNTEKWERDWKIKTNVNKSVVLPVGCTLATVEEAGGLSLEGEAVAFSTTLPILGYNFSTTAVNSSHVTKTVDRASFNLSKLSLFQTASPKFKLILYKALIRPLLEYPILQLHNSRAKYLNKLQLIQNKALRFIYNVKLSDRVRVEDLHNRAKLDPINLRLSKLARKSSYRAKELYFENDFPFLFILKLEEFTDFAIGTTPSLKPKKKSLAKRINEIIFKYHIYGRRINLLDIPDDIQDWQLPNPKFTAS